ncbi:MAG: sporulation initiation factor Spo0A C-terminal domain-containing protein, partial [Clostridia bacterium]
PNNLLNKLIKDELIKLGLSDKYVGFKYLTELITNSLKSSFYTTKYIDFFEYVSRINLSPIDSIERAVRHMLSTTWKQNKEFRQTLRSKCQIDKPNSKNLLNAIITHFKEFI